MTKPTTKEAASALTAALDELTQLQEAYEAAQSRESAARRDATEAVNRLNDKQKEVDRLMADLVAGSSGDWARKRFMTEGKSAA